MGKIRTRVLGVEEVEEAQKKEQKQKSQEKKLKTPKKEATKELPLEETKQVEGEKKVVSKEKKETKMKAKSHVRGKKYQQSKKHVDEKKLYSLKEAVTLIKKIKYAAFDESVELHMNVESEGLKGDVALPHATGKVVKVKIVNDEVLANLEKGVIDFDILITHPSFMPKLAKYAKVLGPRGLMPNPKAGTVSPTPEEVAKKFEKGTLRWKTEAKFPLIHQMIGKVSHEDKNLVENAQVFINSVGPAHIQALFIKTTMGPSLKIAIEK